MSGLKNALILRDLGLKWKREIYCQYRGSFLYELIDGRIALIQHGGKYSLGIRQDIKSQFDRRPKVEADIYIYHDKETHKVDVFSKAEIFGRCERGPVIPDWPRNSWWVCLEVAKSLPAEYNGAWYKSTIEARWVIGFEDCGIKAVYEAGGMDMVKKNYRPDFYLPDEKISVEVKFGTASKAKLGKSERLVFASSEPVLVLDSCTPEAIAYRRLQLSDDWREVIVVMDNRFIGKEKELKRAQCARWDNEGKYISNEYDDHQDSAEKFLEAYSNE